MKMIYGILFHLLVIHVRNILIVTTVGLLACARVTAHVVGVEACGATLSTGLLLGFVHVLGGGLPGGVDLGHGSVDLLDVVHFI